MTKQMFYISMACVCVEERVGVVERGGGSAGNYISKSVLHYSPILE